MVRIRNKWTGLSRCLRLISCLFILFPAAWGEPETDVPEDPVREMLQARFHSQEVGYRAWMETLVVPVDLGLARAELLASLGSMREALSHWKIQFRPGYAAFAVQTATRLLAVNPQSMEGILQQDDDVLLHEAIHLTESQVKRQRFGLYAELVFMEWLQMHLNEDKTSQATARLNHALSTEDVLRLRLWSSTPGPDAIPLKAMENSLRASWICEIQAYQVQLMAFERDLQRSGSGSLKDASDMLRKTLLSETGRTSGVSGEADPPGFFGNEQWTMAIFQSFNGKRVTEGFQEAILSCVLLDGHNALLFETLADADGWSVQRARKNPLYRRRLLAWARREVLRWDALLTEPYALSAGEIESLTKNGLISGG